MRFEDPEGAHRAAGIPVVGVSWQDVRFQDDDIAKVIFQDCTFERLHLVRSNLEETIFLNCRFDDCVLDDCRLIKTRWMDCSGTGLRIVGGDAGALAETVFSQSRLAQLTLEQTGEQVVLAESEFERVALNSAGCRQRLFTVSGCEIGAFAAESARWNNATAVEADFSTWTIDNAHFERCSFIRANGRNADFSKVRFESCNLYQSVFSGARFRWAERSIFAECDLTEADFGAAHLKGALFAQARADGAGFEHADLEGALFPKANLAGARFARASAPYSAWLDADLTGADLQGVNAFRAAFRNAVLARANVQNARLVEADLHGVEEDLAGADLRGARESVAWRAEREAQMRQPPDS